LLVPLLLICKLRILELLILLKLLILLLGSEQHWNLNLSSSLNRDIHTNTSLTRTADADSLERPDSGNCCL